MFYYFYRFLLSSCVCQLLTKFMMMIMMMMVFVDFLSVTSEHLQLRFDSKTGSVTTLHL